MIVDSTLAVLFWTATGFLLGSLPFAVWLGQWTLHSDVRRQGDGNPGAATAWRAGGWPLGLAVLLLDYLKGAVPVGLAHYVAGIAGWGLLPLALAPVLGHAFSPFLGFKGGKAVNVTFGIWSGLTLWEGPTVLGIAVTGLTLIQTTDGWTVVLGMLVLTGYLLLGQADAVLLAIVIGNVLILTWTHRQDLRKSPHLRVWLLKLLRRW